MSLAFPDVTPSSQVWRQLSSTATLVSPLSGNTQRIGRPADRWACTLTFDNLNDDDRAQMQAFVTACRGSLESFYVPAFGNPISRGSYATDFSELVPDPFFGTDVSNWSATDAILTHNARRLRIEADAALQAKATCTITIGNAQYYAIDTHHITGNRSTLNASIRVGTTSGADDLLASTVVTADRHVAAFLSNGTTAYVQIRGGSAVDKFDYWDYVSISRCFRVDGASQTGSKLDIKNTGGGTNPILKTGDFVEVGGQLLQLTTDLTRNASNTGTIQFTPPLRASPSDGDYVLLQRPQAKMVLARAENQWSDRPGFSDFVLDCVEVIE